MKKLNKNAKVEKLTKKLGISVRLIVIGPFIFENGMSILADVSFYIMKRSPKTGSNKIQGT